MQQINLYLPEFRPNREPLRAVHMLWSGLAFLVLLLCFSVYSNYKNGVLEQQLAAEQKSQEAMQAQLKLLNAQKPAQASAELDAKITQLQKNVQRHQQILAMISSQDLGNDKGFSVQLNALSHASLNSISLERFSLQRGGKYAELSGVARSADQIPHYLQRLRKDSSFANVGFGVLNIERDAGQGGLLKFSLAKAKDDKSNPSRGAR
jgi:Tfp pilus assembly protein PilN